MTHKEKAVKTLAEICRLIVGAVFVFSGFVKAVDPMGFEIKIAEYLSAWGAEGFRTLSGLAAFNLIAVEFTLGVAMLLGVYRRYTSLLSLGLMALMTPLTLYLAIFNPVTDCGCFGDAIVISNWETFFKNVVLLAAAWFVYAHHSSILPFFSTRVRWFVPLFAYTSALFFSYWNYSHLPMIDFRPYKAGVNIPSQMSIPQGAPEDEYRYSFVYEKDGRRETFTLDDYPAGDSAWTFVESRTELVKKGYTPPIAAFNIFDAEGNDVAEQILAYGGDAFLLIAADIDYASDKRAGDISSLYDYARQHGIPFYCITGSSAESVDGWTARTGAEYPFLSADETLLKTIIRSNPGLVWLGDGGTIRQKWHYNDMPEEEEIDRLLSDDAGQADVNRLRKAWMRTDIYAFILPLLLVWAYDFMRFRRRKRLPQQSGD
ncbi:MAG: DoxX family protein [Tannerellaceae bacterium]|jgi:uncharacterized membrane protein YphA (DoxX/SURF4 family)|nr:DoxX family protein [Tannerellaceae bacterium]